MSELDDMTPMTREMFKRKYVDTHTEYKAMSMLADKNGYGSKNSDIVHPSDLNAKDYKELKKPYEIAGFEKRAQNLNSFVYDGVEARAEDILDKKQMPFKDLLKIAVSIAPKKIDINANVVNTFADLWTTTDIEGKADYED